MRPAPSPAARCSTVWPRLKNNMERSSRCSSLILILVAAACLSGCDEDKKKVQAPVQTGAAQQGKIYKDLDACLADAKDMDQVKECREGYRQAMDKMAEAPQFAQQAKCEDVYGPGNCVPRGSVVHDGGGSFVPFMMGYMIGGAFGGGGFGGRTVYAPVFIDRSGSTYAGGTVINRPAWTGGAPTAAPSAMASSSVSRGGFGSTASAKATVGG